jgi:tripartite tricarboxylate transporter TctB family protein
MISQRAIEVTTAALTGLFGAAVVISSLENGIGWGENGVEAGTFPLLVGSVILLGSFYNLARGTLVGREISVTWPALRRIAGLFIPAMFFIALIPTFGMYVAAGGYVLMSVGWRRELPLLKLGALAMAAPVFLYVVFEKLFLVTLPHGTVPRLMGF